MQFNETNNDCAAEHRVCDGRYTYSIVMMLYFSLKTLISRSGFFGGFVSYTCT